MCQGALWKSSGASYLEGLLHRVAFWSFSGVVTHSHKNWPGHWWTLVFLLAIGTKCALFYREMLG